MLIGSVPGLDIVHVPYKGAPPALTDLSPARSTCCSSPCRAPRPHIEAGRLRGLGVTTLKRSPVLPNVPRSDEIYPGFEVDSWYGVLAPAGTPKEVVARLHKEIVGGGADAEGPAGPDRARLHAGGHRPDQFAAMIKQDVAQWAKVVKAAKLEDTGK